MEHADDIASNFKGVDFYKDFTTAGNDIYAKTAVSMKTTIVKNVDDWLKSDPVKKNLGFLTGGLTTGIEGSGKKIFMESVELHIYMPKINITDALKNEWISKLNSLGSGIKFEIKSLDEFIN